MINNEATANAVSLSAFTRAATGIVLNPHRFFAEFPLSAAPQALVFLIATAAAHSLAGLKYASPSSYLVAGSISLANAVGMTLIATGLGYILMRATGTGNERFSRLFSIYAYSSGISLLVSWVPSFQLLSEIWKWWLIVTGLTAGLGFKWYRALSIVGCSIVLMVLLFHCLLSSGAQMSFPESPVQ